MNKSFSHRILTRFNSAIFSILLILFIAVSANSFLKKYEFDSNGIFIPTSLISQTKIGIEAIEKNNFDDSQKTFPCGEKQHLILSEYISEKTLYPIDQSRFYVTALWNYIDKKNVGLSCKTFPLIIKKSFAVWAQKKDNKLENIDRVIKENYSESLSWEKTNLCIYADDKSGKYLAHGSHNRCKHLNLDYTENTDARNFVRKELRPIIALAKNHGTYLDEKSFLNLTIDSDLQYKINEILNCQNKNCKKDIDSIIEQTEFATVVILDANNNQILASGCYGERCNDRENKYLGILKGTNIEVPPASTAKLLFSLAISQQNPSGSKELSFQIKTSGQLDQYVKKRNEWWEKIVICDRDKYRVCKVPEKTTLYATTLGWNRNCNNKPNIECGASNILYPLGINKFSPRSGRLLVQSQKNGPHIKNQNLLGPYLNWDTYDDIRAGKKVSYSKNLLEKSSLAIQSVIGAGDNRTTSLGLAMLSAGIYQSATTGYVSQTKLFFTKNDDTYELPKTISLAVLNGMQKVVMPTEKGWVGDGTASHAFKYAFGKYCKEECPIFAKTGTVSMQDRVFSGTTLFTGVALNKKINSKPRASSKNIAIGVICKSKQKNSEHLASKLGMLIIREMENND